MGIKEYFSGVFVIEKRVDKLNERIEVLRHRQISGGGTGHGQGVQKSRNYRRQEDYSVLILETQEELAQAKLKLLELEIRIKSASSSLDSPVQRAIITWRYICRLKWKDIAARVELSEMQAIREHNAAIEKMEADAMSKEGSALPYVIRPAKCHPELRGS